MDSAVGQGLLPDLIPDGTVGETFDLFGQGLGMERCESPQRRRGGTLPGDLLACQDKFAPQGEPVCGSSVALSGS